MIPFDTRLCEVLEAIMAKEPESKYVQTLLDTSMQFMLQTNRIFQNNLDKWSDEKLKMYGMRVSKYANINQAFNSINTGKSSIDIIKLGENDCKAIFKELNEEFSPEWNMANSERRKEILESILLPHMLIIRFLEKFEKENF